MACLETQQLVALSRGMLSEGEAEVARRHLETCSSCRERLDAISGPPTVTVLPVGIARPLTEPVAVELPRGSSVGRYLVHARVGVGGMGEVYSAVDPELGRKVALKLVAAGAAGSSGGTNGQARLLREAQAMAKLSHPSVVTIYDVGTYGGGVFLAMELVEGQTLRQWLAEKPRTQAEILSLFLEAGRGLAAAHKAGLVHRDFKPDNVLVDSSGHARVTDFGLARATTERDAPTEPTEPVDTKLRGRLLEEVTAFGTAVGTPGYMSPEQFRGDVNDGRTDQFAFCVTLYRALYGVPPFEGRGVDLETNVLKGTLAPPPPEAHVPGWLREVVLKGLKPQPSERFASMDELLAALERDPSVARRRLLSRVGTAVAVAVVALGVVALSRSRAAVCEGGPAKLAPVWNETARANLEKAFGAVQKSYATGAGKAVVQELDARAAQWVASYVDACEAASIRREQSAGVLELRMRCLDDRLGELKAMVDLLSNADEKAVRRSVQAVTGLETTRACADVASLSLPVRPPSDLVTRAQVDGLRDRLAGPRAQLLAGRFQEGVDLVAPLRVEAQTLGWLPLVADVHVLEGELLRELGKTKEAETALLAALVAAEASRHDTARARAVIALTSVVGLRAGKVEQGEHWGQVADGILQRLGQPDELVGALWTTMGALADSQGNTELAMQRYERSLAARVRAFGDESFVVGFTLNNLGVTATALGDFKRADAALERALELQRKGLGERHPALSAPLTNLGSLRVREGRVEEGLVLHEQAEAVALAALGPSHPQVGTALGNEAEALVALGRFEPAEVRASRALAVFDAKFPDGHPAHVYLLITRGEALLGLGRAADAVAALTRGLTLLETNPAPPEVGARLRYLLAKSLVTSGGDRSRARELVTQARHELPPRPADASLAAAMNALAATLGTPDAGR